MIFYKDEEFQKIKKLTKKWLIFTIFTGIFAIGLFVLFIIISSYQQKLLYQLLSFFVLAVYGVFLVFVCDTIFIANHYLKRHYILTFLSGSEKHECKIKDIKKSITVSNKIKAAPVVVLIDGKEIVYYLLEGFKLNLNIGDQILIETRNRFIFAIKEKENE